MEHKNLSERDKYLLYIIIGMSDELYQEEIEEEFFLSELFIRVLLMLEEDDKYPEDKMKDLINHACIEFDRYAKPLTEIISLKPLKEKQQ